MRMKSAPLQKLNGCGRGIDSEGPRWVERVVHRGSRPAGCPNEPQGRTDRAYRTLWLSIKHSVVGSRYAAFSVSSNLFLPRTKYRPP